MEQLHPCMRDCTIGCACASPVLSNLAVLTVPVSVQLHCLQATFAAQLVGMLAGCFLAPATFHMFVAGQPNLGEPGSEYPLPRFTVTWLLLVLVELENWARTAYG